MPETEFSWVPYHEELANKLLDYRNRQQELIDIVAEANDKLQDEFGIGGIRLTDRNEAGEEEPLEVMDPFTFFGSFHRAMNHEARFRVMSVVKQELNLKEDVPTDLSGIPTRLAQSNRFFWDKVERGTNDVDLLWELFEEAVKHDGPERLGKIFDDCLDLPGTGISSLTQGMFWINPDNFLPMDQHVKPYLQYKGVSHNNLNDLDETPSFRFVSSVIEECKEKLDLSFPAISAEAYDFPSMGDLANILKNDFDVETEEREENVQNLREILKSRFLNDIKSKLDDGDNYSKGPDSMSGNTVRTFAKLENNNYLLRLSVCCGLNSKAKGGGINLGNGLFWGLRYWGGEKEKEKGRPSVGTVVDRAEENGIIKKARQSIGEENFITEDSKLKHFGGSDLLIGKYLPADELYDTFEEINKLKEKIAEDLNSLLPLTVKFSDEANLTPNDVKNEPKEQSSKMKASEAAEPERTSNINYWKLSPGRNARYWNRWKDQEIITIGWNELGDLSNLSREEFENRKETLSEKFPERFGGNGPNQAWKFAKEFKKGDKIVVSHGIDTVLGIGTVTGEYHTEPGADHIHRREVEWDDLTQREVDEYGWRRTLVKLDKEKFESIRETGGKDWTEKINVPNLSSDNADFQFTIDETSELYFPDALKQQLENQISQALSAGKHLILVGPPGTGKSKLAKYICDQYRSGDPDAYTMSTATSDWTTFDTIGGLMPRQNAGGNELQFEPGLFLKCFRDSENNNQPINRWLIIDEINRADIDKAFGALFSVLTGDPITLSFEDRGGTPIHVRSQNGADTDEAFANLGPHEYMIPDDWRLIATMNTFDKTSLYEMSYAFMRRFAFVPVSAPDTINTNRIEHYAETWEANPDDDLKEELTDLWDTINAFRSIGPAITRDLLEHRKQGGAWSAGMMMYVLPQFEGVPENDLKEFFGEVRESVVFSEGEGDMDQLINYASDFFDIKNEKLDPDNNQEH